jgi:hypothetical protein
MYEYASMHVRGCYWLRSRLGLVGEDVRAAEKLERTCLFVVYVWEQIIFWYWAGRRLAVFACTVQIRVCTRNYTGCCWFLMTVVLRGELVNRTHTHTHTHTYLNTHVHMRDSLITSYTCICVCVCVYIYIYIYMRAWLKTYLYYLASYIYKCVYRYPYA